MDNNNMPTTCTKCGAPLPSNARFCGGCGAAVEIIPPQPAVYTSNVNSGNPYDAAAYGQQPVYQAPSQPVQSMQPQPMPVQNYNQPGGMSKKEFYNVIASKNTKTSLIALSVLCFFSAAVALVLIFTTGNLFSVMDVLLLTAFGVLLLMLKNWIVSLVITCYAVLGGIISVASGGRFTGLLVIIGGVMVTIALKKLDKAYAYYLTTGQYPSVPI